MNTLTIRQANIQDLPKIVPIFDSYREYFKQVKDPVMVERFLFEKFEHLDSVIFIAEQQNEVIGFAQLYPIFSSLTLQRVWLLNDFFIAEEFRNCGVGTQLFARVKEFALITKSKGIELSVEHTNIKAWEFWGKQGFKQDEEFRYYFYKL
ncbi:GNAT superfamily N-acetyltransferase [Neobacillus niacini]|uniref:GNAT family N-acetyltransferase n=1 Tax=Neobacillus niacini TaxID=86668 RepID=UPI00285FAB29|nr:GNAT family N-acetyltransferase [Neobacillus niacini]MDR7076906.1 GNAT superfamily N-acetyltransferase [Neobacillus niacini]